MLEDQYELLYAENGQEALKMMQEHLEELSIVLLDLIMPDDMTYFGAQEAARAAELRIPLDISFAGYDGNPLTQSLHPRLTTVRQNREEIGLVAARLLIDHIENPDAPVGEPTRVPVELLKGETVAWCNEWTF